MFTLHDNLYHYTKFEKAFGIILPTMKIMMGSFNNVNDPRESKTWPFTIYTKYRKTNDHFDQAIFEDISRFITHKSLMLCLTRDDPDLRTKNEEDANIRVGFAHPRMWSQYGDNHKGACLVFDRELLHSSIVSTTGELGLFHGPINYRKSVFNPDGDAFHLAYLEDIFHSGISSVMEPHIAKYHKELFFNKHVDWRDEWEYRWVFRSKNETPILIPIEKCIKAVILGSDCQDDESKSAELFCKENKIPLYRIHHHGWALNLLPEDSTQKDIISFDGISFSIEIPCKGVFVQARDHKGKNRPVRIDNNGNIVLLGYKT